MRDKFIIKCRECGNVISSFKEWFNSSQKCNNCGENRVWVEYKEGYKKLLNLCNFSKHLPNMWHYYDFLPISNKKNIVSGNEGVVPIDRWKFIEKYAKERYDINCQVFAHRNDQNHYTGTFKDMAGTIVASVLKENNIKNYVVASTGNIANAYAKYLAKASIKLYAFIPHNASKLQEVQISAFGQKVFRVNGDYAKAKKMAAEFAQDHGFLLAAGNFDPMRIEAKKTMVYEWIRRMNHFPSVYIQALSGGTGPLGIEKAFHELESFEIVDKLPRQILIQSNKCDPMAQAWKEAKKNDFPDNWYNSYQIIQNPVTEIPTLSTGNPKTYPVISKFVRKTKGEIISSDEQKAIDIAKLVALESNVLMGPAAALPVSGLFDAFAKDLIEEGDVILINVGEDARRSPGFLENFSEEKKMLNSIEECKLYTRESIKNKLWQKIYSNY